MTSTPNCTKKISKLISNRKNLQLMSPLLMALYIRQTLSGSLIALKFSQNILHMGDTPGMEKKYLEEIFWKIDLDFLKAKFLTIFFWIFSITVFFMGCTFFFKYCTFSVWTPSNRKKKSLLNTICWTMLP